MVTLRTKAVGWLALTFLVGGLAGFGITYLDVGSQADSDRKPERHAPLTPAELTEKFNRKADLALTEDQRTQMVEAFVESQNKINEIEKRSRGEIWQIRLKTRERLRSFLEPAQFDRLEAYFESRRSSKSNDKKE